MISAFFSLVFVLAAMVVFFRYIRPEYEDLQVNKATLNQQLEELDKKERISGLIAQQSDKYDKDAKSREILTLALPVGSAVDLALNQINGLATQNGVSISSISVAELTPTVSEAARRDPGSLEAMVSEPRTTSFAIAALGSYENFRSFLAYLETNLRIFDIKDISIQRIGISGGATSTKNQAQAPTYSYTLTLQAYYQLN
ncbi:MAG: type 4a pilus biogenesis protein PilO [Candidatus Liptonbacteria bacterium]